MKIVNNNQLNLYENDIDNIDQVCDVINENRCIEKIAILSNKIDQTKFNKLAEFLHNNKTIKKLKIHDVDIGYDSAVNIATLLTKNCSITGLKLNKTLIDNAGAVEISKAVAQNKSLKYLALDSNKLNENNNGITTIMENFGQNSCITTLSLNDNMINESCTKSIVDYINKNRCLKLLLLADNCIGDTGGSQIVNSLIDKQLHCLDISNNHVCNETVFQLSELLKQTKTLQTLFIGENSLSTDSLTRMCDSLCFNTTVKNLFISYICSVSCVDSVVNMLQTNSSINVLCFSYCDFVKCGSILSNGIGRSCVKVLDISMCKIDSDMICDMITNSESITRLSLINCWIDDVAAEKILDALCINKLITHLDLSNNLMTDKICDMLIKYLKNNTVLNYLNIHTGLSDQSSMRIIESLNENTTLHTLIIDSIKDYNGDIVARLLENNCSLTKLESLPSRFSSICEIVAILDRNKNIRFKRQKVAPSDL